MEICKEMELKRAGYAVMFVILLCALAIASSEGGRKTIETVLGNGGGCRFTSLELDGDMGEQACMKELADRQNEAHEFAPRIPIEQIHESIRILPTNRKRELLACLRKKIVLFRGSRGRPSFTHLFIKTVELIFGGPNIPRRYLISHSHRLYPHHSAARAPLPPSNIPRRHLISHSHRLYPHHSAARAPLPPSNIPRRHLISHSHRLYPHHSAARAPLPPSPSPVSSPSSSPSNAPSPSAALPTSSPSPSPTSSPAPTSLSPAPTSDVVDLPPARLVHPSSRHSSKKHDDSRTAMIAAVVTASVGVVVAFALLLFCCCKGANNKVDPKVGKRDERPLLISLSELSAGSSQKSYSLGNSTGKDLDTDDGSKPSLVGNLSMKPGNGTSMAGKSTLEPHPGRSDPQTPPPAPTPPPPPPPTPKVPPPPPRKVARPPPLPPGGKSQALPLGAHRRGPSASSDGDSGSQKTRLKPFFWDKVLASPDQSMVWHEISAGSFQFNEEMMESLFGYSAENCNKSNGGKGAASDSAVQYIQIIDAKKAQNLSILLRALNVTTEEVVEALQEGNHELPVELLQTLLKMAPTTEEELKLRLFAGEMSQLGLAERFLKVLVDIPFAFKRLECLLFMCSMEEDVSNIRESFATLEVACKKLRNSRLFLKLLEAVLKTGNRMNDGTYRGGAQAFKLDTLLKLSDVKGTDGKTTLLHFVVQEIIRSEGVRAARSRIENRSQSSVNSGRENRSQSSVNSSDSNFEDLPEDSGEHYRQLGLQVISGLSSELEDIKRAAAIDSDNLTATVSKFSQSLFKTSRFLNVEMKSLEEDSKFQKSLSKFVEKAEADILWVAEEEKRIMSLVKSTADYFHGNAGKDEGLRLFTIVRDFLVVLDKTCKEVREAATAKQGRNSRRETPRSSISSPQNSELRQRLFPAIVERRVPQDSSFSDDESSSSSP